MRAADVARRLGGKPKGGGYLVRCPAHRDRTPSLSVDDGDDGRLLVHCFAGCLSLDVLAALRRAGVQDNRQVSYERPPDRDESVRRDAARALWNRAIAAQGTLASAYLESRGITRDIPSTIRYAASLRHRPTGLDLPALVAAVHDGAGKLTAVQRIFLTHDGRKSPVRAPKMSLGLLTDGAARLAPSGPVLGLAEGVEDALSAQQLFDIPCWAVLGAERMHRITLSDSVLEVQIFADNGEPGHRAAERAADIYTRQGRRVALRYPPAGFEDWNAALQALTVEGIA